MNATFSITKGNVLRTARRILSLAGIVALALICVGPARAQSKPPQTDAVASSGASPTAKSSSSITSAQVASANPAPAAQATTLRPAAEPTAPKGQTEGLTVHGHWTIVVKNPDGKVVSLTEFENTITAGGKVVLASILGQNSVPGPWAIAFSGGTLTNPCLGAGSCVIVQAGTGYVAPCLASPGAPGVCSPNLAVNYNSNSTSFSLTGTFTVGVGGNITSVQTTLGSCGNAQTVPMCLANPVPTTGFIGSIITNPFSSAPLPGSGVPVAANQIVQVTVTFSFS
ncbi:MAG: hypothetical protein WAM91_15160 [Candidatus Acidiferrales bacterium]